MSISIADAMAPSIAAGMLHAIGVAGALAVSGLLIALAAFTALANRSVREIPSSEQWKPYIATLKTQDSTAT